MSVRRFRHSFSPSGGGSSAHNPIELTTTEIADAAIREIVQLSLSAAPFDLLLEQLLVPMSRWFCWIGPLGEIRETKTALSGLFGRFVARAYMKRYLGFAYFEPIRSDTQSLKGWPHLSVKRVKPGDLPDWIVASTLGANNFAIAEAKGSHDTSGPANSLERAKKQVQRIDIVSASSTLITKRYAIATRWAIDNHAALTEPWLTVHDPELGRKTPSEDEKRHLVRSIALGHFAALAEGFQLRSTTDALRRAKIRKPGSLRLEPNELVRIDRTDRPPSIAISAVVTPSGIVTIPIESDIEEFRSAIQTVYGARANLLAIDVDHLRRVDKAILPTKWSMKTETGDDQDYWSEERSDPDGSEMIPLKSITLSRVPPDQVMF